MARAVLRAVVQAAAEAQLPVLALPEAALPQVPVLPLVEAAPVVLARAEAVLLVALTEAL